MYCCVSRYAVVLLLATVTGGSCRSIAGYGAADPDAAKADTWHGLDAKADQRQPPDLADDGASDSGPSDSGPSDSGPFDSVASEPSVSSDGSISPDDVQPKDLKPLATDSGPLDATTIPDAGGCTNPHPILLTTDCWTQSASCTPALPPDADCDGIPGVGQQGELDPLDGCNLLTQQNECNTNWLSGALSDGCRVTIPPSGADYDTGISFDTLKDRLVLAYLQTGVLASNATVELVGVVNTLRVRCFIEGKGSGQAIVRVLVTQGSSTWYDASPAAPLNAGDYLLALWSKGGYYYCALSDPVGMLTHAVAQSGGVIINQTTAIKMRTSGGATARVDYLRVFDN